VDAGLACHSPGTLTVGNSGMSAYLIDQVANPDLTLCRGATYVFAVNTPGHPFYIKTVRGTGVANAFSSGVTGNGATSGNVTFVVPADAPGTLFYVCSLHSAMTGTIHIVD
jgi:plastocyanin